MFRSVLIANRGEIACRIMRTLRRLGITAIAVYSDVDCRARHVREANIAVPIGDSPAPTSYLNPAALIRVAIEAGAEAIHPGYGFLSESPLFARQVIEAGLVWVGPPPEVLELTGNKLSARRAFEESDFPVAPGAGPFADVEEAVTAAREVDFPIIVKPVMGGGGIGMGVAFSEDELRRTVDTACSRGSRFFGDPRIYIERYTSGARHIEIQVLFDDSGSGIALYERECSIQRRHQKVVEETPSPAVDGALLSRLADAALHSMKAINYVGAGTVECLFTPEKEFLFLEVNSRLQVEHTITEETCGVDLVEEQLRIAAGEDPSFGSTPNRHGHAIECRIYAEDPITFLPSPGRIRQLNLPPHARCDFGYEEGDEIPFHYDPLIGKIIATGWNRATAIQAMQEALEETEVEGPKTNLARLRDVLSDERFASGMYDTQLLD